MTNQQIQWAMAHDWYLGSSKGNVVVRHELEDGETRVFNDFKELRAWAGY